MTSSCGYKSLVQDDFKYYSETNVFERLNDVMQLSQRVRFNNHRNGLHSNWYNLQIRIRKDIDLTENKILKVSNQDTSQIVVKYEFNSNRYWEVYAKSITGKIKIIEINDSSITIKEDLIVITEHDEKVVFKGKIKFETGKSLDEYQDMEKIKNDSNKKQMVTIKFQ